MKDIFNRLKKLPSSCFEVGPGLSTDQNETWQVRLDEYFLKFPCLTQDKWFHEFLHICPEYFLPCSEEADDDSKDGYFALSICPLSDEGFLECITEGHWIFAEYAERYLPRNREEKSVAHFRFSLHFCEEKYLGVYVQFDSEETSNDWNFICPNFLEWCNLLLERGGRLLKLDQAGKPTI